MKPQLSDIDAVQPWPRQKILFQVSNLVGMLIFLYYGMFHWQEGHAVRAHINFAYVGLAVVAMVWVHFGGSLTLAQNVVLALLIPRFCLMMMEGGARSEGPLWIVIYPVLAFFYTGRRAGMKWLMALIAGLLLVLFLKSIYFLRSPFPHATFLILIACLLTVAMYVYAYDKMRSESERALSALNEELSETVDQLARLNADKNDLMNMIAHDLRNPLTAALLAARQLERQDRLDTADNRRLVGELTASIQHTMRLITNFLGLKAIESGKTELSMDVHELSAIVRQVMEGFRERASEKNIELAGRFEPAHARCDQVAIAEVTENLISNALKFSPPGTRVEVSTAARAGNALLTVRDQGPGISDQDKKNMFLMFGRLTARPTAGEDSIGLGLSIARKLTELMAGRIYCESVLGQGAAFTVELPLIGGELAAQGEER